MPTSKPTVIKIDQELFPVFMAIMDTGGMAFAWTDEMLKQDSGGTEFANDTVDLMNKIVDEYSETGKIKLCSDSYLHVLTSIRGAMESFLAFDTKELKDMYEHYNPNLKLPSEGMVDGRLLSIHSNIMLDFLECHAPKNVMNKWVKKRKDASVRRLNFLLDGLNDE